ncbi:hypothetical protein IKG28_00325 [Candidatus Saccharibacteria bacterium]|nr:hypothetical protein [Candidatus Saccharibacteria bacterium]
MKKCKEKLTKTQKARLQAQFDYATDMLKREDIAGVREMVQDGWKDMIQLFDAKTVVKMVHPITLLQNYEFLCEREKNIRAAQEFLKQVLSDPLTSEFETILECYTDELRTFGIDPDIYSDNFAKHYAKDFIIEIDNLPEILSANKLIANVKMRDILDEASYSYFGFEDFLKGFIVAGGDASMLAAKFLDEIGYSCEYDEFSALFDLLEAGCDIDVVHLADCVDVNILNNEDKNRCYRILKENGADRTILARFAA